MNKKMPEMGVRRIDNKLYSDISVATTSDVINVVSLDVDTHNQDCVYLLNLNSKGQTITLSQLRSGDFTKNNLPEIIKCQIMVNAAAAILVHVYQDEENKIIVKKESLSHFIHLSEDLFGIKVLDLIDYNHRTYHFQSLRRDSDFFSNRKIYDDLPIGGKQTISLGEKNKIEGYTIINGATHIPYDEIGVILAERSMYYDREHFEVVNLDENYDVIAINNVSVGELSTTIVHPREVFKSGIVCQAKYVVFTHNHPSGTLNPSQEDLNSTLRLIEGGQALGIEVLDHIITGDGKYLSLDTEIIFPAKRAMLLKDKQHKISIKPVENDTFRQVSQIEQDEPEL